MNIMGFSPIGPGVVNDQGEQRGKDCSWTFLPVWGKEGITQWEAM